MNFPIPILLYHRIDESSFSTSTSPRQFREHLQWLKRNRWRSLSAAEFSFMMMTERALPERSFLITFDDGYESVRSAALDILREFDFKAISFLSTGFLRGPQDERPLLSATGEQAQYMSWEQVRELQSSGIIDCQSHSHTHSNFTGRPLNELRDDLGISVELLAHELRLPRSHFEHLAWPWGLSKPEWRDIATGVGFKYQYGVSRQSAHPDSPLDQIPRTCFDAATFSQFHRQIWLQTGRLSSIWDVAYPLGRKLRQFSTRVLKAAA